MKPLPLIGLLIALAGCAAQMPITPAGHQSLSVESDRPPILFIGAPPVGLLPQQIIGEESHAAPGEGLS